MLPTPQTLGRYTFGHFTHTPHFFPCTSPLYACPYTVKLLHLQFESVEIFLMQVSGGRLTSCLISPGQSPSWGGVRLPAQNKVGNTWISLWSPMWCSPPCTTAPSSIQDITLLSFLHPFISSRSSLISSLRLPLLLSLHLVPLCRGINQTINVMAIYIGNIICKKLISTVHLYICYHPKICFGGTTIPLVTIWGPGKKEEWCIHLTLIACVIGSM